MVEEEKLVAVQAVVLIDALDDTNSKNVYSSDLESNDNFYENKMLRIIVESPAGDKVNVQLPVKIVRQILKVTGKLPLVSEELHGIDLESLANSILACLDSGALGNIIEVDGADGSMVRVFID